MEGTSLISSAAVRGAYKASQTLRVDNGPAGAAKPDFSDMVREAAENAVQTMRSGEATTQAGLRGGASTQEVVEAVMAMESTVKVAVSVRDRFVAAYQEILRMPI